MTSAVTCNGPAALVHAGCTPEEGLRLACEAGLVPPLLAKPLWADGRNGAHELALLADEQGIGQLCRGEAPSGVALPVTLQQYVDHGACLFKVDLHCHCCCFWHCRWGTCKRDPSVS